MWARLAVLGLPVPLFPRQTRQALDRLACKIYKIYVHKHIYIYMWSRLAVLGLPVPLFPRQNKDELWTDWPVKCIQEIYTYIYMYMFVYIYIYTRGQELPFLGSLCRSSLGKEDKLRTDWPVKCIQDIYT